ncbi:MAG: pentapeptide repeat-containing protein [Corynebacterium sp.]|uniref:pentapeptide repeat-containing protein n=1 Tax=Corynebacterium sp. TaxID=1720 RepID=UPI0026DD2CB1|nr:pentapeptide repeat-containing protein [Corynebacterium sp.]MDO5099806.1 pentapeptide repeat-containing protein [Corynebacterium sp.]
MISRNLLTKMIVALGMGGVFGWLTWSLLPENKQRSLEIFGSHAHLLLAVSNCLFVSALVLSISFACSRPDKTENTFDKRIAQFFFDSESDDNRLKLNPHIGVFLFVAVSALYIPVFLLWAIGFLSVPLGTSIEVWMKILLPIVGGIGGVFYLVLKYREQQNDERKLIFDEEESRREQTNFERDIKLKEKEVENASIRNEAEKNRADEREKQEALVNAIRLLESESAHVRVAGVYALAKVSDRYPEEHKQTVVDILCGYLRTDRSDQLDGGKFKDAAVESAIIKVIGEHLRKDREGLNKVQTLADEQLWCDCSFDFRGATFREPVNWEVTIWNKPVDFSNIVFLNQASFNQVSFAGITSFTGADFAGDAWFVGADFAGDAWFVGANFSGTARFMLASFNGDVGFGKASFAGDVGFEGAKFFGPVRFIGASFSGDAGFDGASFASATRFGKAIFSDFARFVGARFNGDVGFGEASFADYTFFGGASFVGSVWFDSASFAPTVWFGEASFAGDAWFDGTSFAGDAWFEWASFINQFFTKGTVFENTPTMQELLLANPEAGTAFGDNWNIESYNSEWTLEKKTERLKEVYKRFCKALNDHPQKVTKLAGIQKTISENFPDVTLDFKELEAELEKELEAELEKVLEVEEDDFYDL